MALLGVWHSKNHTAQSQQYGCAVFYVDINHCYAHSWQPRPPMDYA